MTGDDQPPSLEDLDDRLRKARGAQEAGSQPTTPSGLGLAFRLTTEMVSALLVGGGLGWLLDQWLDTRPWLLLVFLLIGGVAGLLNAYRTAMRINREAGDSDAK